MTLTGWLISHSINCWIFPSKPWRIKKKIVKSINKKNEADKQTNEGDAEGRTDRHWRTDSWQTKQALIDGKHVKLFTFLTGFRLLVSSTFSSPSSSGELIALKRLSSSAKINCYFKWVRLDCVKFTIHEYDLSYTLRFSYNQSCFLKCEVNGKRAWRKHLLFRFFQLV